MLLTFHMFILVNMLYNFKISCIKLFKFDYPAIIGPIYTTELWCQTAGLTLAPKFGNNVQHRWPIYVRN